MNRNKNIYKFLVISCLLISILLGYFSERKIHNIEVISLNSMTLPNKNMSYFDLFSTIFFTNLLVGVVIIYFIGYITGGLLAIFVLFSNGFVLGRLFFDFVLIETIEFKIKILAILHIPIEIYAFLLLSFYSHNGFYFVSNMVVKNKIHKEYLPKAKMLLQPIILLFIAAIIESLIIYLFIL